MEKLPYSEEKALEEAQKMRAKVKSGEAEDYNEAEKLIEEEKVLKIRKEKEVFWENKQKEIDEQVKEAVAAFNVWELPTSASCEGHISHGISAPWLEISASNQPEKRFIGEKEIFQKIAAKYGIALEDVKRGINREAWAEALAESSKNDETPEYKQWRKESQKLLEKTSKLLEEYYQGKEVSSAIRLEISEGSEGEFRVHNGGEDYKPVSKKLTDEQKKELTQRLFQYQEEMKKFAKFLRDKYFTEAKDLF